MRLLKSEGEQICHLRLVEDYLVFLCIANQEKEIHVCILELSDGNHEPPGSGFSAWMTSGPRLEPTCNLGTEPSVTRDSVLGIAL
jgi:hypothetical protein